MPTIRGVLLDVYGTLVEEDHINLTSIATAIHGSSREPTTPLAVGKVWYDAFFALTDASIADQFLTQAVIGRTSLAQTVSQFGSTLDIDAAFASQQRYWASPTVYEETVPFLAALRSFGLVTCIVSNADRADVDAVLALHGLTVDHVVTSEDARHYKPHPRIFETAMEMTGLSASDLIHVGDSWRSDVRGASSVGVRPVWLNRTGHTRPEPDDPTHEVSSLTDLIHWLQAPTP